MGNYIRIIGAIACLAVTSLAAAAQYRGQVTFNGLPIPGATVTAAQGANSFSTLTDAEGRFSFSELADGTWTIEVQMTGFAPLRREVMISSGSFGPSNTSLSQWQLNMLPLAEIKGVVSSGVTIAGTVESKGESKEAGEPGKAVSNSTTSTARAASSGKPGGSAAEAAGEASTNELGQLAIPGLLINGSQNNGAASPFAQFPAFGNHRSGAAGLYNGGIGIIFDNSALDASPFSLSGQRTPKPVYNRITGTATFGGPLKIPHLLPNGPTVFAAYQWTRNVNNTTLSALMPDAAERGGDFSQALSALGGQIFDPVTGLAFPGGVIPPSQISPQAQSLLSLYPLPNFTGNGRYNYQALILSDTHQDAFLLRLQQNLGPKNQVYGGLALLSTRTAGPNIFGFLDGTHEFGVNSNVNWSHRLNQDMYMKLGYQFSRLATQVTPYFDGRQNISGEAGITGNNQEPTNWGPPALTFASGIAGLSDAQASFNRNQTSGISASLLWEHGLHNVTFGGDFRRQEFNVLSQQDPRGTFTFTGAATQGAASGSGSDFADFLLGIPDTSSIAFGNPDKYFRESVYDAYVDDDFRLWPNFTLDTGIRWEYGAPITEAYNRLVNLDIASGFSAAAPVLANNPLGPLGPLTGQRYPNSLVRPDWTGFEPRVGIAWRPIAGSSLVVRAGYGIYDDTSVYQTIALQMAQQAPLSKSLSVQNSRACPFTLANAFNTCPTVAADLFAIDPNFQVGYAQNWDVELQRDLPGSMQLTATYLGTKGTRGLQEFLPNTYPLGAANPCPSCPSGFTYFGSNGNSTREAAQIELRRRLESGFTATLQYTLAKAIDDDSMLGGAGPVTSQSSTMVPWLQGGAAQQGGGGQTASTIAQNWLDLAAERSLSSFDQRHLLNVGLQYTTGMGLGGGSLLSGFRGSLLKEWSFLTQISYGSGFPETPMYLAPVPGTGVTGSIRPEATGAPIAAAPPGLSLNPAAYSAPPPGEWGSAGRYSISGPAQFSLDASIGRTFRLRGKYHLDFRIDSTNALNHPTFTSWVTTINSAQFGLPAAVSPMRSLQTTLRLRF
ncbi:MAG TPA: carboxypeptidase-like regulatory domain-containing protein [Terriglobia bacterium]|nr:carboxypeptidase-like regulatory domain-containing protein [Terriglobia bacterium]